MDLDSNGNRCTYATSVPQFKIIFVVALIEKHEHNFEFLKAKIKNFTFYILGEASCFTNIYNTI